MGGRDGAIDKGPSLRARVHLGFLTPRGWGLFVAGVVLLLAAWIMGRRELLNISLFLLAAPLLAAALLRFGRSPLNISRSFHPAVAQAGDAVTVRLEPGHSGPSPGTLLLTEALPEGFGPGPEFLYPCAAFTYRLRPTHRGVYPVGPVTARFTDPFGLSERPGAVDAASSLTIVPVPEQLLPTSLAGDIGSHGQARTSKLSTPDSFDVMTREYRDGDSVRRIHWPATARHGALMVRQEDYQSTPRATVLLDRRPASYRAGPLSSVDQESVPCYPARPAPTTARFEWAVTAALSVGAHLAALGYAVQVSDHRGTPLGRLSASAPDHATETYSGPGADLDLALVLAALGLETPTQHERHREPAGSAIGVSAAVRHSRDPLVLITGDLVAAEAHQWVESLGSTRPVGVLAISSGSAAAAATMGRAGWNVAAVPEGTTVADAWARLGGLRR
ncbi:DUF58 domain-containing protein [Paeniglutamicibacter cryotolerans]|uniref:Uncharacterized protein (DUF58 family) n=1 Tax=Paeniglutamicibacter cryotolerans TaxID=670079 RepID=A0A839QMX4_9MICC|nr:DUF58 domain-containing protein [Paeniglutamicibacter cryotolerans]MBB2995965.1 uncharacterized protein (DUF58 family) [Paeniglutamicibacter cryotolerans]